MSADLSAATSIEGLSLTYATLTAGAPAAMSAKVTEPDAPIPPVVDLNLLDAHWATATEWWGDDTGGITNTFDGGVNIAGDPGYEFTCTIGGGWGVLFGVDSADIGTLTPGVWNVWVKNTSANEISVGVAAYRDGGTFDNGGGGGIGIAPGVTKKVSFDLSAATSIEELALSISSAVLGEVTFQVVEEPIPASKVILTDADWASAAGMWGDGASTFDGGADIAGDPGYDFTCTTYGWGMLFGVNMGGITGETWEVTLENTGSITNSVEQYIVTVAGNHVKGGVIVALAPGEVVTMTANLSTNGPIDTLGLFFVGPADGDTVATAAIAAPLTASEKYALWAADYPGMGGLNDDDENGGLGDGMDNLFEYAVGGDPLVDDAAALIPVSTFLDADTWLYIYRRRNDAAARGLTYDLQFKSDLIYDLTWTSTGGAGETGTNTTDLAFDVVTNTIPTVMDLSGEPYNLSEWVWDETLFLNLEITENF